MVVMWNFLSCDASQLASWSFRIFFGGPNYNENSSASQKEVHHMLDVIYGISKEFDYHPNLNWVDNSIDRDVQQMRNLVKKIAGKDGTVEKQEFVKLVQKTPMLMMRIISAQTDMRKDCGGTGFWNTMSQQRKRNMTIDQVAAKLESMAPNLLWRHGRRGGGAGGGGGGGRGGSGGSGGGSGGVTKSQSKYAIDADKERKKHKKTKLDAEEEKAAQRMQNVMRSKQARKKVRKARAVKQVSAQTTTAWSEVWDPHYSAYYYYNHETEASAWEKPPGFVSPSGN
jgi:hypothetical protein